MTDSVDTIILHQELAYADVLPISVATLASPPSAPALAAWTERNLRLLQACAVLEELPPGEADDATPLSAELQRIDLKVNLLLDMVGVLVANLQSRPASRSLRFNAQGLLWEHCNDQIAADGTAVQIEIYLRDSILYPLVLTGAMRDIGIETLASARIDDLPESVAEHIKKLVFRRHRRQIAVARATRRT